MNFIEAMKIAEGVFEQYKIDQLKWWKRLDGTPMLNDLAVRFSEAFMEAATEKKNAAQRCKVGSICTPETCTCALIDDDPNVSVSTNQPVQAKALTDEQIKKIARNNDAVLMAHGNYDLHPENFIGFARALLASQPSVQPSAINHELRQATLLAKAIWGKHYRESAPHWEPLPDLMGVISQIDNMTCRLELKPSAQADVAAVRDAAIDPMKVRHAFENIRNNYVGWEDNANFKVLEEAIRALKSAAPTAQPQADGVKS